ncbi:hypothetical protein [Azospirillum sp. TSA6c]|uniref:hypothetical protein n=1 Tax=unclassified Azospirillum TaxID=2630922 RepID=UPI000D616249|nr:hypothetical protein [Azospirillum sp. TSA6c]PWC48404.1 hypothetical protein TSA6c_18650 [Azospirillum sp. TSA6c]
MSKDMMRARRRHDRARMVAKVRRILPWADVPQKVADNMAVCSCWMCGNPRRYRIELTIQERRQDIRDLDWDH